MTHSPIRFLVGLGNPGTRYHRTRHNAGFWFVDRVAARYGGTFSRANRFFGETCDIRVGEQALRVLKPMTYMNGSGQAVAAMARFYRYNADEILVVHDEIDLPPGVVRLKRGGGDGGHQGLRDVIPQLGTKSFARIRIGVGHPGHRDDVVNYVLRVAPAPEQALIDEAVDRALERFETIVAGDFQCAMNALHRKPQKDPPAETDAERTT